jgi:hypothetical protein
VETRKADLRRGLPIDAAGLLVAGGPAWRQTAQT